MNRSDDKLCAEIPFLLITRKIDERKRKKKKKGIESLTLIPVQPGRLCTILSAPGRIEPILESRTCTHGLSPHFTSHTRIHLPTGGNLVGRLWATTTAWLWITEETPTKGDSEATTGACRIIFYPNGFKFQPMLWPTGTRRFLSCPISFCHCHWCRQKAGRTCFTLTEAKD